MPTRINRSIIGWAALAALNSILIVPYLGSARLPPHDFGVFYAAAHVHLHDARASAWKEAACDAYTFR
jgi:hypothetical protein